MAKRWTLGCARMCAMPRRTVLLAQLPLMDRLDISRGSAG